MSRYAYLIQAADSGSRLSTGTVGPDLVAGELAAELVQRNRTEHSYYTGPRTCWIWPYDGSSLTRLDAAPDGAERFDL